MTRNPKRIAMARSLKHALGLIGDENYKTWKCVPVHIKEYKPSSKAISSTVVICDDNSGSMEEFVFSKTHYGDLIERHRDEQFFLGRTQYGNPLLVLDVFYPRASPLLSDMENDTKSEPDKADDRDTMKEILEELRTIRKFLERRFEEATNAQD